MPVTIKSRLKKALIEILEDANASAKERLEAAQLLAQIDADRSVPKIKRVKTKSFANVLG